MSPIVSIPREGPPQGYIGASHTSFYNVLDSDIIISTHKSVYQFYQSGVLGISDRICGCWSCWETDISERGTYLHLYNTLSDERFSAYERSFTLSINKTCFTISEFPNGSVITCLCCSAETFSTDRKTKIAFPAEDERYTHVPYKEVSEIVSVACNQYEEFNERSSVYTPISFDEKWCFIHFWRYSERYCAYRGRLPYGDQRECFAQVSQTNFESVRFCVFDVCTLLFDVTINPLYNSYVISVDQSEVLVFEDRRVNPNEIEIINLPIDDSISDVDLVFIDKQVITEDLVEGVTPVYLGRSALYVQPFVHEAGDTYIAEGWLVPLKEVVLIKTSYQFYDIGQYTNGRDYYDHLKESGMLSVRINGEAMGYDETIVLDVPAFTKIPFSIRANINEVLEKENMNLELKWAYPYKKLSVFKTLIMGIPFYL